MFNNVLLCLASRATTGVGAAASGIGDNSAEFGNNSAESAITPQNRQWRRRDRRYRRERDPMLNSVMNGEWSNSVLGSQIPDGPLSKDCGLIAQMLNRQLGTHVANFCL